MNKSYYRYNPETGIITRQGCHIESRNGPINVKPDGLGYLRTWYKGKMVRVHRLAWLLHYGAWPHGEVDHINRDRTDNRIANLRIATRSEQTQNKRYPCSLGYRGVKKSGSRFAARICVDGKPRWLGSFDTAKEAHIVYALEALELYGPNARLAA